MDSYEVERIVNDAVSRMERGLQSDIDAVRRNYERDLDSLKRVHDDEITRLNQRLADAMAEAEYLAERVAELGRVVGGHQAAWDTLGRTAEQLQAERG